MTRLVKRRRGQPFMVLAVLIVGWAGLRAATWQTPFPQNLPAPITQSDAAVLERGRVSTDRSRPMANNIPPPPVWSYEANGLIAPPRRVSIHPAPMIAPLTDGSAPVAGISSGTSSGTSSGVERPQVLASHQLLWLAAMAQVPVPGDVAMMMRASGGLGGGGAKPAPSLVGAGVKPARARTPAKRWSADAWLYLRPNAQNASSFGPRFASYGASQAGAVIHYRLKPDSAHRPAAYLRASQALAAGRESEVALGLSARPVRRIPLGVQAELRITKGAVRSEIRPAASVVTQIPPVQLPLGMRAQTYVAAGYVGGDFATAFVDGQARIETEVARFDLGRLRAGGGIWGGAQKGAARLDVGPSASLDVKFGETAARVSMDYRLRVSGDAQPDSGIAITLVTGF